MKRILALSISGIMALSFFATTLVFAVEDGSGGTSVPTTTTEKPEMSATEKAQALAERVAKRKAELKSKLTTVETARLKSKCKASQGLISSVSGRIKGIETSRGKVYPKMVERLTDLSAKLKNKGADTTELDASIALLKTKIETFNADLLIYKQAVSDLVELDCTTDPDGFKASLESARSAQQQVSKDGKEIRTYLNDIIKPLLKTVRTTLVSKPEGSSEAEGVQ